MDAYVGRFAPSPTGALHLGNARSALLGWLHARALRGRFLLRIEDLDRARCRPEHVSALFADLEYLGLWWDGEPVFQRQRGEAYAAAIEALDAKGWIYPCFCTRSEISRAVMAPHGLADEGPAYPGTCAALGRDEVAARERERQPALRFRTRPGVVRFEDLVQGPSEQDVQAAVGDFVVRRNDGVASYQLAVVVDDAASGVTCVLRGDDLLPSTPRQIQLYQALGHALPAFAHVPLLLGPDGKRLTKREGAFAVAELRRAGVPAERVVGLLASWSGLGLCGPVRAEELVSEFRLDRLPKSPVVAGEAEIRSALGV